MVLNALCEGKQSRVQLPADAPGQALGAVSGPGERGNLLLVGCDLLNYRHAHTHGQIRVQPPENYFTGN